MSVNEYVMRLKRRRDYLEKTAGDNGHARSELTALTWAIAFIEAAPMTASIHQQKYKEKHENQIHNSCNHPDHTVR